MNKIDYALRINNLWWYFQNPSVRKPKYLYIYRTMGSGLYGDDDNVEFEKWYWYHSDRDYGICELSFGKDEANFLSVVIPTDEKANFFCLKEILKYAKNGLLELIKSNINEISAKFNTKNCLKD